MIHSINVSVNECPSPAFPFLEQPTYDIVSMNTSAYNENNYRQTHNVCNNPNKRTQLFVNQKEPKNLKSRTSFYNSNDNVNINDVNVHSRLTGVTSEINCSRGTNRDNIIPLNKIEISGNEKHPTSRGMFGTSIENQYKIENQSSYWGNQNNGCIRDSSVPHQGLDSTIKAETLNNGYNEERTIQNNPGSLFIREKPGYANMFPMEHTMQHNPNTPGYMDTDTQRWSSYGAQGENGQNTATHMHCSNDKRRDDFVPRRKHHYDTYSRQFNNETTPVHSGQCQTYGPSQNINLNPNINTWMPSHMEPLESYNGTPIYNRTGKYQTQEHKQGIYPTNAYFRQNSENITSHSARSKRKEKEPDHYDGVRVEWPDYICYF